MADKNTPVKPTESELEILQLLWEHGPSTVRFINDELSKNKETGYTTTLKLMQIMHEKGMVQRDEAGRSHVYKAAISESATQSHLLDRFLETTFRGSALKMVMQALGNKKTSEQDLNEIRNLLDNLKANKK
jgi:predicted transcriptional regulator